MLYITIPGQPLINTTVELMKQGSSESGWSRTVIIGYATPHLERSNTAIFRSIAHKTQLRLKLLMAIKELGSSYDPQRHC